MSSTPRLKQFSVTQDLIAMTMRNSLAATSYVDFIESSQCSLLPTFNSRKAMKKKKKKRLLQLLPWADVAIYHWQVNLTR